MNCIKNQVIFFDYLISEIYSYTNYIIFIVCYEILLMKFLVEYLNITLGGEIMMLKENR